MSFGYISTQEVNSVSTLKRAVHSSQ